MPVVFKCSSCDIYLKVSKEHIGKKVRCPECEVVQPIPDPRKATSIRLSPEDRKRLAPDDLERLKKEAKQKERERQPSPAKPSKDKKKGKLERIPEDSGFESAVVEAAGIELKCFCGKNFKVGPEMAGQLIECEACGRSINVPDPDSVADVDLAPIDDDTEKCPFCGAAVSPKEKTCHACGKGLVASRRFDRKKSR